MKHSIRFTLLTAIAICIPLMLSTAQAAEPLWYEIAVENDQPRMIHRDAVVRYQAPNHNPPGMVEKAFKAGDTLNCTNFGFDRDPVNGTVKQCISTNRWLFVKPGEEPKAQGWECLPYNLAAVNFSFQLSPPTIQEWANAEDASYQMSWWCLTKYSANLQISVGFKRELSMSQIATFVKDYMGGTDSARKLMVEKTMVCKPGMSLAHPDCEQYFRLQNMARQLSEGTMPAMPWWQVAKNGTYGTRPTKVVTAGKRTNTNGPETVLVGTTCQCDRLAFEEGTITYCSVEGAENAKTAISDKIPANRVALCAAVPPVKQ